MIIEHFSYSETTEFLPIIKLLRLGISESPHFTDRYIRIVVRDAKIISNNPNAINSIDQDAYRYSVPLGRLKEPAVQRMSPERLTKLDFELLLRLFESL